MRMFIIGLLCALSYAQTELKTTAQLSKTEKTDNGTVCISLALTTDSSICKHIESKLEDDGFIESPCSFHTPCQHDMSNVTDKFAAAISHCSGSKIDVYCSIQEPATTATLSKTEK